jgi:Fic family protein
MWKEIDELKRQVDARRPIKPDIMKTLSQKFREEWTYHSNAIEGNTFSYQETAFFLREGLTVKGKSLREHLEIINHAEAIDYLQDALDFRDLSEGLIKDFHAILFQGVRNLDFQAGEYKKKENHVLTLSGEIHHFTPYILVPQMMEQLIQWYSDHKEKHPVEIAAFCHHRFVAIHPFPDGNGRVGRLVMNYILMKNGFPPAIVRNENRQDYYLALERADQGDSEALVAIIKEEVTRALKLLLSA